MVKRILWGTDIQAYEGERPLNRADIEELQCWRRVGPLGKLHNTLMYILKTPQRCDTFEEIVRCLYIDETVFTVFVGNITRWSSDYESILCAFRLREAVDEFTNTAIRQNVNGERDFNQQDALVHDELLPRDWEFLASVKEILAPFKEWTLILQVRYSNRCVVDILPAMDELLDHLELCRVQFHSNKHLLAMVNQGWVILDK